VSDLLFRNRRRRLLAVGAAWRRGREDVDVRGLRGGTRPGGWCGRAMRRAPA